MNKLGADFWDYRYSLRNAEWDAEPNEWIVNAVSGVDPGSALDVGCGEGADAIWLAQRGWDVTAVDISAVALERARLADHTGRVHWQREDLLTWEPPTLKFDLAAAHFLRFEKPEREIVFGKVLRAVRAGGTLLVVAHDVSDLETTIGRFPMPQSYYTAADIAALLEINTWDVVESGSFARDAVDPDGQTVTVHDVVLRARRM